MPPLPPKPKVPPVVPQMFAVAALATTACGPRLHEVRIGQPPPYDVPVASECVVLVVDEQGIPLADVQLQVTDGPTLTSDQQGRIYHPRYSAPGSIEHPGFAPQAFDIECGGTYYQQITLQAAEPEPVRIGMQQAAPPEQPPVAEPEQPSQ